MNCDGLRSGGTVAVVGAGPAGAMLARLLQMRGYRVRIFERDASATSRPQGGSLDLRRELGQRAVDRAGLAEAFRAASRDEVRAFRMLDSAGRDHPAGGGETHEDPGPEVDRGDLRRLLLDSLAPGTVAWGHLAEEVRPTDDGRWWIRFVGREPVDADLVVGADGAGSRVRRRLTPIRPRSIGMTMLAATVRKDLWRGSELADLVGEGSLMFAGGGRTIFVQRCASDLILLYYSLTVAEDWPASAGFSLDDEAAVLGAVRAAYGDWSPAVVAMLTQVEGRFQRWPLAVMPPDYRWATQPGLTMIGDASHAMPPFTGKGVNLALLDALELADSLSAEPAAPLAAAIAGFEAGMQGRTRREVAECLAVGRNIYGIEVDFGRP